MTWRLTPLQWLIVSVATLGFVFDQYELLLLPLVVQPALAELAAAPVGSAAFNVWIGLLFWLPAICGGLFGLLGGYLTDRYGRRRVLVWSILLYAGASVASAFSTSATLFLVSRCLTLVGVCVEFVAGIAWLAESFPEPKQREGLVGVAQAISSGGGLLVTSIFLLLVTQADRLPAIYGAHVPWRYACLSGMLPALPLILVRPFMPESPMWLAHGADGSPHPRRHARIRGLFAPALRRVTLLTTIATAASYALAYGAMQHLPRIVGSMPGVAQLDAIGKQLAGGQIQFVQEAGGLAGRIALVFLVVLIVARRRMLRRLQGAALVAFPLTFAGLTVLGLHALQVGVFTTAAVTAAQLSFWGNYLPRVFPTGLRGTGESFAVNVGGRIVGTSAAFATTTLATAIGGARGLSLAAAVVATIACVAGLLASRRLVEPAEKLPH